MTCSFYSRAAPFTAKRSPNFPFLIVGFRMTLSIGTKSKGQRILRLCVGATPPVQRVAMLAANYLITIKQVKKIFGIKE